MLILFVNMTHECQSDTETAVRRKPGSLYSINLAVRLHWRDFVRGGVCAAGDYFLYSAPTDDRCSKRRFAPSLVRSPNHSSAHATRRLSGN